MGSCELFSFQPNFCLSFTELQILQIPDSQEIYLQNIPHRAFFISLPARLCRISSSGRSTFHSKSVGFMAFHLGIGQVTYSPAIGRTIHSPAICQKKRQNKKRLLIYHFTPKISWGHWRNSKCFPFFKEALHNQFSNQRATLIPGSDIQSNI